MRKLAYVSGNRFSGFRLNIRDFAGVDGQTNRFLTARAEFTQFHGAEFSVYRAAQDFANAINKFAEGK